MRFGSIPRPEDRPSPVRAASRESVGRVREESGRVSGCSITLNCLTEEVVMLKAIQASQVIVAGWPSGHHTCHRLARSLTCQDAHCGFVRHAGGTVDTELKAKMTDGD